MFKKPFIEFLTKRRLKRRSKPAPCSFEKARRVGIIINLRDSLRKEFEQFILSIQGEGKVTDVLKIGSSTDSEKGNTNGVITKSDVSFTGGIKSEKLKAFIDKEFDFLLILDHQLDYLIQYIASLCKASHKVGFNDFSKSKQLDLQIKPEKDREFDDLLKYTKMIKHD